VVHDTENLQQVGIGASGVPEHGGVTQVYTTIPPPQLKRAVAFYEEKAQRILDN